MTNQLNEIAGRALPQPCMLIAIAVKEGWAFDILRKDE